MEVASDVSKIPGREVRVEDRVGQFVPIELEFVDDRGQRVKIGDYLQHDKVVVMSLNYSDCPGLCIAQLGNLVDTLKKLDVDGLDKQYQIVTVSIDPREEFDKAARTKAKYSQQLGNSHSEKGWHFLVGNQPEISSLAESLGYYYTYDMVNKRYNHPAVLYFISPEGRVCRYLTDLGVEPEQFRLAVAEAGQGKLSRSVTDVFVQFCFTYDPQKNRYSADAKRIMTLGFSSFAILMLGFLAPFWFGKRQKPSVKPGEPSIDDKPTNRS